ncbi:MAG: hypothetical protein CME60_03190 [Halobacteriovoraceae bacterium]|nr:hypothetical protein [Halobacteriovoraceae bacterium]
MWIAFLAVHLNNILRLKLSENPMNKLFITLFLLASFAHVHLMAMHPDDFDWKIKEEKDGIKVYTADQHKETGIIPIKANTTIEHSLPRILSVLATTERKKEWIPNLLDAYTVEKKSKYERVEYTLYDAPWPFYDRAFVISTKGRYNKEDNTIFIDIASIEHPKVPLNPDYVRGRTYIGSIYMKGLSPKKTFFEITLLTDFSGNIPTWIINMVQRKWPYKMFRNIKKQLAKDDIKIWPEFKSYDP